MRGGAYGGHSAYNGALTVGETQYYDAAIIRTRQEAARMKNATNRTKYRRCWAVFGNRSEGLLVRAEPLGLARRLCQRMVEVVHETDGALLLAADPAWAAAINTVLVMKGLRISELRRVGDLPTI
jgi:hypothetical protein